MHYWNEPAGIAASALFECVVRIRREDEQDNDTYAMERLSISTEIMEAVERGVDSGWGGIELRFGIGANLAIVEGLYEGWLEQHISRLLPSTDGPTATTEWRAFWSGYFWNPRVYDSFLVTLRPYYEQLVSLVYSEIGLFEGDNASTNRLIEHIAVGRIRELDGFGTDGLLGVVTANATDDVLADLVGFFRHELDAARKRSDAQWLNRVWNAFNEYWIRRTREFRSPDFPEHFLEEASAFIGCTSFSPVSLREMVVQITTSVRFADRTLDFEELIEWLIPMVSDDAKIVLEVADAIANRLTAPDTFSFVPRNYRKLIETLHQVHDSSIEPRLVLVVDRLLHQRQFDLRDAILD